MANPSTAEVFKKLLKRDMLKKILSESLSGLGENGRAVVLVSRGVCIAQSLTKVHYQEDADMARNLFIQEYELLEETRPDDPFALKAKREFLEFANHCIVSMPRGADVQTQREVWSEGLRKWEKSVPVWEELWETWVKMFDGIEDETPEKARADLLAAIDYMQSKASADGGPSGSSSSARKPGTSSGSQKNGSGTSAPKTTGPAPVPLSKDAITRLFGEVLQRENDILKEFIEDLDDKDESKAHYKNLASAFGALAIHHKGAGQRSSESDSQLAAEEKIRAGIVESTTSVMHKIRRSREEKNGKLKGNQDAISRIEDRLEGEDARRVSSNHKRPSEDSVAPSAPLPASKKTRRR